MPLLHRLVRTDHPAIAFTLDGEPGEIELFVGETLRGDILTWVSTWCGFAGAG